MNIESNVEIAQPPSVVYEFLLDEENLPLWVSNFVKLEEIEGEQGQVGSISKHTYNERGRIIELNEHIIELVENRLMKAIYENENMEMTVRYELIPQGDTGTLLKSTSQAHFKNLFSRIIAPLMRRSYEKRMQSDLDKLKDAIEELTDIE